MLSWFGVGPACCMAVAKAPHWSADMIDRVAKKGLFMRKTALNAVALACIANMALVSPAGAAGAQTLVSTLDGASVPDGGDPNGEGSFQATVNTNSNTICYQLRTSNLSQRIKAHIHEGAAGEPGRPVIDIELDDDNCTTVSEALLTDMLDNPANYYVDVLTTQYRQGAIRGQLSLN